MDLTESDIHEIRQQGDLRTYLRDLQAEARATNARQRALVLAQPDLAAQLLEPPTALERADQWTGYIPGNHWDGRPNRSPVREQLAALVAEAERRANPEPHTAA